EDMPVVGAEIDGVTLARRIEAYRPSHAVVEQVGARPGQGVTSMFRFGHSCGVARGVLASQRVPVTLVAPTRWKRHFGLGADKEESRALALRLFPASAEPFARKKDHGRAEAALLARWLTETTNRMEFAA